MRLAFVLLALAVLLIAWFTRSAEVSPTATPPRTEAASAPSSEVVTPNQRTDSEPAPSEPIAARTAPESSTQPNSDSAGSRCRVFGRVLDADGVPLAAIDLRMSTVGEPWIEGEQPEELDENGGLSTETDESGRFLFDVPFPTSSWISLRVRPGPYHASASRDFGFAGGRDNDPLLPDDNDLGDFVLAPTGAVEGTVVGQGHGALEKATATVDTRGSGFFSGRSDESGRWLVGHVQPGTFTVGLRKEGFLSAVSEPIEIRAGATSVVPVIELASAPTVRGRVIDEQGVAVENVRVWGWPVSSGRGAGDRTDENGNFTVYLPQDEPYSFEFSHPEFEEQKRESATVLDPGTTDALIALRRARTMTFRVVDSAGQPIERFGLRVGLKPSTNWSSSSNREPEPLVDHPNGEVTLAADPALHVFCVQASGFAPRRDDVVPDTEGGTHQTITLEPGSSVAGRVTFDGKPVFHASVRLERARRELDPEALDLDPQQRVFYGNHHYDLDEFTGRQRRALTTATGRFRIEDLPPGTYSVAISAEVGAPFEIAEVTVERQAAVDLGELELTAGATVRGRITVSRNHTPGGVELYLDRTWDEPVGTSAPDGSFRIEGLSPGEHSIVIDSSSGLLVAEAKFPFVGIAGEIVDVDIDLRPLHPAKLVGRVFVNGEPVARAQVSLRVPSTGSRRGVAKTSAAGTFAAECVPNDEPYQIVVHSETGLPLGVHPESVELLTGTESDVTVSLDAGTVVIVLPDDWVLPERGSAVGSLQFDDSKLFAHLRLHPPGSQAPRGGWGSFEWNGSKITLGLAMPGRARINVNAQVRNVEDADLAPPVIGGEVQIVAGETVECRLAPRSVSSKR